MLVQHKILAPKFALPPLKSFLLWSATLAAFSLALSVPVGLLVLAIAAFSALTGFFGLLNPIAIAASSFVTLNLLFIIIGAAIASKKGLYPHQVRWLNWLNPKLPFACPLTCELASGNKE
ncbi:hypothetical protein [Oscillatoria sp. FACHB-1406]|uniref:hypothetical protein n=1 Tax=Oscillatoria sp. FACHB-1406 TaxID=2692846 RepID=UPI00168471FA|nr:hypothetical protein [Oscillatoria sp. FACHB-1406]MBD2578491.1 hypothetical protein [Oscillatoria sp. FACHB-1406]